MEARPTWRWFERHDVCKAFCFAWAKAGSKRLASIAIMAMTTRSSISVNAPALARAAPPKLSPSSFRHAERGSHGFTRVIETSDGARGWSLQCRGCPRLSITHRVVNGAWPLSSSNRSRLDGLCQRACLRAEQEKRRWGDHCEPAK